MAMTPFSDTLRVDDIDELVEVFLQNGAAIIQGDVCPEVLQQLEQDLLCGPVKKQTTNLEGRLRYRAGWLEECKIPWYENILASNKLRQALDLITINGSGEKGWKAGMCGGDEVAPMTHNMQDLHSDWAGYKTNSMRLGYALVVSVAPRDVPVDLAPIRLVPWNRLGCIEEYPQRSQGDKDLFETGYELTLRAGEFLIRDCRVAHGGTPNRTVQSRCLPAVQIASPQMRRRGY